MHEKNHHTHTPIEDDRTIGNRGPVSFRSEALKDNRVSTIGSLYLSDSHDVRDRQAMDAMGLRLDIIDLRSAPIDKGVKQYDGQLFDPLVNYLVVQGTPDWENQTGYKGLRTGEVLTIGRHDKVSSKRFNLADPRVSRSHATIYGMDDGLMIEDNGSSNGTSYVKYDLSQGDIITDTEESTITKPSQQETTDQTESNLARVISETEVAHWALYMKETKRDQYASVQDLIEQPRLAPVTGVEVDGKTFLMSEIMQMGNRKVAAGYISVKENPGKLMPRLFYRSDSDGGWRSSPCVDETGTLSKGTHELRLQAEDHYGHYVQLTKPNEEIVAVLERQDRIQEERQARGEAMGYKSWSFRDIEDIYAETRIAKEAHSTFAKEVTVTKAEGLYMDAYIPGGGAKDGRMLPEQLRAMQLPAGFEPDFSVEPEKMYHTKHTLAGETAIEVFPAVLNGRAIEWHVAHDEEKNRVWVDRIIFKDGKITSYGTQQEVILAGALSAKPFDYVQQLDGMIEGRDWTRHDRSYGDISAALNNIPAIQHYRLLRGVYKK